MKAHRATGQVPRLVLTCVIAIALASACGTYEQPPTAPAEPPVRSSQIHAPGQPDPSSAAGFFPLDVGNVWIYDGIVSSHIEGDSLMFLELYSTRRELVGTEGIGGRTYTVERQTRWSRIVPFPPPDSSETYIRYRQDKAGLYELEAMIPPAVHMDRSAWTRFQQRVEASAPPEKREAYARLFDLTDRKLQIVDAALRAGAGRTPRRMGPPGGAEENELTRLKYPLHPGQEWSIRSDLPWLFSSYVESQDVLILPAGRINGYRIRIDNAALGANDRVEVWYGRDGFLGLRSHIETVYTDYGNPYGEDSLINIFEEFLTLEDFDLVRPARSNDPP